MENVGLFPNMSWQMIAGRRRIGFLDTMSAKVGGGIRSRLKSTRRSTGDVEPPRDRLIMAILGILVGGMVIAMYLPIFKLGKVDRA